MIMKWEEWWEKSITRGTSGDMVMDILSDWKEERTDLLIKIKELEEELKHSRISDGDLEKLLQDD
jgi:hypothetical protein